MDRHLWLGVALIFAVFQGARCLRNVSLEVVPEAVQRGHEAILRCRYDLEDRPLYSVKWYRGRHEFYRFAPKESPATKTFPITGINVDLVSSNGSQVMLRNVDFRLSGNFSCEVTVDAPSFSTAFVTKYLTVVSLPERGPVITSGRERYDAGDTLEANCTSPPSKPSTQLSFLLNNVTVDQVTVKQRKVGINDGQQHHNAGSGLQSSELSLVLELLPSHYSNGQLNLRCLAEIPPIYSSTAEVQLGQVQREPVPERELYKTGGGKFVKKLDEDGERLIGMLRPQFEPDTNIFDSATKYHDRNVNTESVNLISETSDIDDIDDDSDLLRSPISFVARVPNSNESVRNVETQSSSDKNQTSLRTTPSESSSQADIRRWPVASSSKTKTNPTYPDDRQIQTVEGNGAKKRICETHESRKLYLFEIEKKIKEDTLKHNSELHERAMEKLSCEIERSKQARKHEQELHELEIKKIKLEIQVKQFQLNSRLVAME